MSRAEKLAEALGAKKVGTGWQAKCPAHDDQTPSLAIAEGNNGVPLVYCRAGCSQESVISALRDKNLWHPHAMNGKHRPAGTPIVPIPSDAPSFDWKHPKFGAPVATWTYYTKDGGRHHIRARCDYLNAKGKKSKAVLPISYCKVGVDESTWAAKEPAGPFPLYGVLDLFTRPNAPVLVVEGEKTAEAGKLLLPEYVLLTSAGGAGASHKSDWSVLSRRNVAIWPDADEVGAKYAISVAGHARGAGATSVGIVELPASLPSGWDLADPLPDKLNYQEILATARSPSEVPGLIRYRDAGKQVFPDYVIKPLLERGGLMTIVGAPGSGKTYFATDLACHVAAGREWFGNKVRPGAVIYCAAEAGKSILRRIDAWARHHKIADVPLFVRPAPLDLRSSGTDTVELIAHAQQVTAIGRPLAVIVIDTVARALAGGNENSSEDMGALIQNCERIQRETRAAVVLVHHLGKNEARGSRGHNSLPAAVDVEITISKRVATITKARDAADGTRFPFGLKVIQLGFDEDGEPIESCVAVAPSDQGLSSQSAMALEALKSAITIGGQTFQPAGEASRQVVRENAWRTQFYNHQKWSDNAKPESKQKAFVRARRDLQKRQLVIIQEAWCWPSDPDTRTSPGQDPQCPASPTGQGTHPQRGVPMSGAVA